MSRTALFCLPMGALILVTNPGGPATRGNLALFKDETPKLIEGFMSASGVPGQAWPV
jgi:hypothetical protein